MATYWVHNGFLMVNGEKMSKSLGNFYTVRDLLDQAPGEALRLALLSGHYRQPLDFSVEALQRAKATLDRWYGALLMSQDIPASPEKPSEVFEAALYDDLNTPLAIAEIHKLVDEAFRLAASMDWKQLQPVKSQLLASAQAIGLLQQDAKAWTRWQPANQSGGLTDAEIDSQIAARLAARATKNYAESDRIRDALAVQGVILEDSAGKTTWRRG